MPDDHLTAAQAGKLLLVTGHRVSQHCCAGEVPGAYQQYGRWFLPAAWVAAEVERRKEAAGRRGKGRPTKLAQRVRKEAADAKRRKVAARRRGKGRPTKLAKRGRGRKS